MRWFQKSLLWASVGCLGVSTAAAQTASPSAGGGVTLCRPQPLLGPGDPGTMQVGLAQPTPAAPAVPSFIFRAQMEEAKDRFLPTGSEMLLDGKIKTALQTTPAQSQPAAPDTPSKQGSGPPVDSKAFVPPQPRPLFQPYNPWLGPPQRFSIGNENIVVYEPASGDAFASPAAASRFYAQAEYLSWWLKGDNLPVLVTTAPATDPEATRGALGSGGTLPLFGGTTTGSGPSSGGRFTIGWFFDPCGLCAIEGSYFFLGRKRDDFAADSTQFPVLARPFFLVNFNTQAAELISTPGVLPADLARLRGSIAVENFTEFQGADVILRRSIGSGCNYRFGVLAGFRYLDLREGLTITENILSLRSIPGLPAFNIGNQNTVTDSFRTQNQFYGGQLGVDGEVRRGPWSLTGRLQVGLGVTHQTIDIAGSQVVNTPARQTTVFNGGLLALPSNSGIVSQDRFSVVPQVGLKLGYNITDNIRVYAGYDFLYWSNVVRPGDQVDTIINGSQIPNVGANIPASNVVRPIVPFRTTPFYAHGLNVGLEVRY